jgi:hypothetical protein
MGTGVKCYGMWISHTDGTSGLLVMLLEPRNEIRLVARDRQRSFSK